MTDLIIPTQADRDAAAQYDVVEAFARHRLEERAKIVAWLRGQGEFGSERAQAWGETFADQIEAGEHLK